MSGEILKMWLAQELVGAKKVGDIFTSSDIKTKVDKEVRRVVVAAIDQMACVEQIDHGNVHHVSNKYFRKELPGEICPECHYCKSGSSGCVIRFPRMLGTHK
jgi:hypothetical protein